MRRPQSIPHILDVIWVEGALATGHPQLVIELPHGATEHAHYLHYAEQLKGTVPEQLDDFFFVNTDIASPELALSLAENLVEHKPEWTVLILRSLIPRTLIDCNRVLNADDAMTQAGKMTPGIPPYIREPDDIRRLVAAHQAYQTAVTEAIDAVCDSGGRLMFVHTYAPRTVGIGRIDDEIVSQLHWAYQPEQMVRWPIRPQVDFITQTPDGKTTADTAWLAHARTHLEAVGLQVGGGDSYPLHPVTTAYHHAKRHPGQSVCIEVRRDLLVSAFTPFEQMHAHPSKIRHVTQPLAKAFVATMSA